MRTLGLIGGMSWESTLIYYRAINSGIRDRAGGLHSAPLLIDSLDFAPVVALQRAGRWDVAGDLLAASARRLEGAGAEAILLATNTMHLIAPAIEAAVSIPFLHIADALAAAMRRAGCGNAALLATRFTMEQPFLRERLAARGIETIVPDEDDRAELHRIIFEELCQGEIRPGSRARTLAMVDALAARGAHSVIAGCTEIGLLIGAADVPLPFFDTALIHAEAGVDFILAGDEAP